MVKPKYKSFDELPLFLTPHMVSDILGLSMTPVYQLMRNKDFPTLRIGKRIVVPKDKFIAWIEATTPKP